MLDDYVRRFLERTERYDRMIFAVHSPQGDLIAPDDEPVRVWKNEHITRLAVRLGLGEWTANRL